MRDYRTKHLTCEVVHVGLDTMAALANSVGCPL